MSSICSRIWLLTAKAIQNLQELIFLQSLGSSKDLFSSSRFYSGCERIMSILFECIFPLVCTFFSALFVKKRDFFKFMVSADMQRYFWEKLWMQYRRRRSWLPCQTLDESLYTFVKRERKRENEDKFCTRNRVFNRSYWGGWEMISLLPCQFFPPAQF